MNEYTRSTTGAKEKLGNAKFLNAGGTFDQIRSRREGQKEAGLLFPVAVLLLLSFLLAFVFNTYFLQVSNAPLHLGIDFVDTYLLSSPPHAFFGDIGLDTAARIALLTLAIFCLSGLPSFFTHLWIKLYDRTDLHILRTVWGVIIGVPLIALTLFKVLGPLFGSFLDVIST